MRITKKIILKWSGLIIAATLLLAAIFVVNWLRLNTSLFTKEIPESELQANNFNQDDEVADADEKPFSLELRQVTLANDKTVNLPAEFEIKIFASDIKSPRFMAVAPDRTVYVGSKSGSLTVLRDIDYDGKADNSTEFETGLNTPHSVLYHEGDLFVAEQHRVSRYQNIRNDGTYDSKDVIIDNLPGGNTLTGGGHTTRTIDIGPDGKLYVSIGSSCNVCIEDDQRRATIMRFDVDGNNGEIFATGLRNTVGFDWHNDILYSVDNGRDQIGDDIPPEEINIIEQGKNYGWPYCYGDGNVNPEFTERADYCKNQTAYPFVNMQAHSAPLGISFHNSESRKRWPTQLEDAAFIAFHGSWNRTVPTGYKVVWVDVSANEPKVYDFITGWLESDATSWGRPTGITFGPDSHMYISDDAGGNIYQVRYTGE